MRSAVYNHTSDYSTVHTADQHQIMLHRSAISLYMVLINIYSDYTNITYHIQSRRIHTDHHTGHIKDHKPFHHLHIIFSTFTGMMNILRLSMLSMSYDLFCILIFASCIYIQIYRPYHDLFYWLSSSTVNPLPSRSALINPLI